MVVHKVKVCWDSSFNGLPCLENEDEIGFFASDADRRPSSCTWVKKPTHANGKTVFYTRPPRMVDKEYWGHCSCGNGAWMWREEA